MNEAPAGRQVPLGHLLSVVHQRLFCTTGSLGVHHLLRYMTQFPLVGPQVPLAWPVCRHALVVQHRWLLSMPLPTTRLVRDDGTVDWPFVWSWLDHAEQLYGPTHAVDPCTDEDWQRVLGQPHAPMMLNQEGRQVHFEFVNPVVVWAN